MDIIYDLGTFEHLFNLPTAFDNIMKMLKPGGFIVHHSPIDFLNHGYYNFNAELFDDVYSINSFESFESCYVISPNLDARRTESFQMKINPRSLFFSLQPSYVSFYFGVFRKLATKGFIVPQQGYYKTVWKGGRSRDGARSSSLSRRLGNRLLMMLRKYPFDVIYYFALRHVVLRRAKKFRF
jgi:hypothetical protein